MPDRSEIGYAAAMTELEAILDDLEGDNLDVDALVVKVERAGELIRVCRDRIRTAKLQVERTVTMLDAGDIDRDDAGTAEPASPDDDGAGDSEVDSAGGGRAGDW